MVSIVMVGWFGSWWVYEVMVEWRRQCPSPGDISILHIELSCVTYRVVDVSAEMSVSVAFSEARRLSFCDPFVPRFVFIALTGLR